MIWGPIIAAGIGVVGNWLTAKKQADTAKQAAQTINQGVRSAEGQITSAYNTAQGAISPFVQSGTAANNTLASLMGLGATTAPGGAPASTPSLTGRAAPRDLSPKAVWDSMTPEERAYVSSPTVKRNTKNYLLTGDESLDPSSTGMFAPQPANASSYAPAQGQPVQTSSSYVQMQAPDGSQQSVPSQYVDHFRQRGATVIQ